MDGHSSASTYSQSNCNRLINKLRKKIPSLKVKKTTQWCVLSSLHGRNFAYIQHKKTYTHIEIWLRYPIDDLTSYKSLAIRYRDNVQSGWNKSFPARIEVDEEPQLSDAVDLLYIKSYKMSLNNRGF